MSFYTFAVVILQIWHCCHFKISKFLSFCQLDTDFILQFLTLIYFLHFSFWFHFTFLPSLQFCKFDIDFILQFLTLMSFFFFDIVVILLIWHWFYFPILDIFVVIVKSIIREPLVIVQCARTRMKLWNWSSKFKNSRPKFDFKKSNDAASCCKRKRNWAIDYLPPETSFEKLFSFFSPFFLMLLNREKFHLSIPFMPQESGTVRGNKRAHTKHDSNDEQ